MRANPFAWPFRAQCLAGFLACAGLLAYALYVQFGMLMQPCPLCILQRLAFAGMGLAFLAGALHGPASRFGRGAYGLLAFAFAGAGAGVAARHVWLQSLPASEVPLCSSMGLDYMVEAFGAFEALAKVLQGSGECAKVDWTFLGGSIANWSFVCFVLIGVVLLALLARSRKA